MDDVNVIDYFVEDYTLFIEAGFVAVKQLDEIASRRLFKAAEVLNSESLTSKLGLGYIALNKLQVSEAAKIFEEIIEQEPKHYLAQALLGVCYLLTKNKRKKGEKLIQDAKEKSDDPTIKTLSDVCLEWADSELKSKNSPFSMMKTQEEE
jgi:lipopolysaccharide biosynthesis regulator YciM